MVEALRLHFHSAVSTAAALLAVLAFIHVTTALPDHPDTDRVFRDTHPTTPGVVNTLNSKLNPVNSKLDSPVHSILNPVNSNPSPIKLPPLPSTLPPHPRMVLTPDRVAEIQRALTVDSDAREFLSMLYAHADWALTAPLTPRGASGPTGVLIPVREALDIMLSCAAAAIFNSTTGIADPRTRYFERAYAEASNMATNWSDWNFPKHALDTGEASMAVGLVYDWLHPGLTQGQRSTLVQGLTLKGLTPFRQYIGTPIVWWGNNTINWNCVCSAGGVIGTLAIVGDSGAPDWAYKDVASPLIAGVVPCVAAEHEDSSWEEGPGYWSYANKYNVWLFSALLGVFNNTVGLSDLPGVDHAARFPLYSTGANAVIEPNTSLLYNWADAGSGGPSWVPFASFWGSAFNDGAAGYFSRLTTRYLGPSQIHQHAWGGFVEALAFFDPRGSEADVAALSTAKLYDFINVGIFRSPWLAPRDEQNYLGFKGGNTTWNHNHLDLGSFVFDYKGQRLAGDLGSDSYALPGYFNPRERWTYYRLNSHGHNVVLFGNQSQIPAAGKIESFHIETKHPLVDGWGIVNVSSGYVGLNQPSIVRRGFISLGNASAIVVRDEFILNPGHSSNISWQLHSKNTISINGETVSILDRVNSLQLGVLAILPSSQNCSSFKGWSSTSIEPILPDPPHESAKGWMRVDGFAESTNQCSSLSVAVGNPSLVATLAASKAQGNLAVRPLDDWPINGPFFQISE